MKLQDFLKVINYDEFEICEDTEKNGLKRIFKLNKYTPLQYICEELLNSEVLNVLVNDDEDENLFIIVVRI